MSNSSLPARIVLTTVASPEEAARAGAHAGRGATGRLRHHHSRRAIHLPLAGRGGAPLTETLLLLKTGAEQIPALEARLHALHSYQTPEFLVSAGGIRQQGLPGVAAGEPAHALAQACSADRRRGHSGAHAPGHLVF